jgi:hypothetical protein
LSLRSEENPRRRRTTVRGIKIVTKTAIGSETEIGIETVIERKIEDAIMSAKKIEERIAIGRIIRNVTHQAVIVTETRNINRQSENDQIQNESVTNIGVVVQEVGEGTIVEVDVGNDSIKGNTNTIVGISVLTVHLATRVLMLRRILRKCRN